jgi:hypothetical protein
MAERRSLPVKFSGNRTISLSAGSSTSSDAFFFESNVVGARGTFKAKNTGTPASGDVVSFRMRASMGDPDGNGAIEFSSADESHAHVITSINTNDANPGIKHGNILPVHAGKIYVINNGASTVTVSGIIETTSNPSLLRIDAPLVHVAKPYPQSRINWRHPISSGLIRAYAMNEGSGANLMDVVRHENAHFVSGQSPTWGNNLNRIVFSGNQLIEDDPLPTKGFSCFTRARRTGGLGSSQYFLTDEDSIGTVVNWVFWWSGNRLALTQVGGIAITDNDFTTDTSFHNFAAAADGSGDADNAQLYIDGVKKTKNTNTSGAGSPVQGDKLYIGGRTTGSRYLQANILLMLIWDRALSSSEMAELNSNPYMLFESQYSLL